MIILLWHRLVGIVKFVKNIKHKIQKFEAKSIIISLSYICLISEGLDMSVEPPKIVNKEYKIVQIVKETPDVKSFRLESMDNTRMDFSPGMFVMLAHKDANGNMISRAFSIASAPSDPYLEFEIHMVHGRFTSILDDAKIEDIYQVSGPYGQFKFDGSEAKVLFLAGGTGIAPFLSMLKHIKNEKLNTNAILLYSVRYPNEIIKKSELEGLQSEINFKMVVTVSRPQEEASKGWEGETGHISVEMIKKYAPDYMERTVYICGPLGFAKACKDMLLSMGIEGSKIKADVWG
ncbi:MAG: ferredoxin--NADP reductase [Candidatus Micrarchaeia archaeon]